VTANKITGALGTSLVALCTELERDWKPKAKHLKSS
jgi:hypothetical protein